MTQGIEERPFDEKVFAYGGLSVASPVAGATVKRGFDLVLSASLLIILMPLIAIIGAAIKVESRGPVFYRATRVGWHGRTLRVLKFRKMYDDADGLPLTGRSDPRFTRLGYLLARTKLDEIPQLWNVVRGQMSIVGPRPEDPVFVALHESDYRDILRVRPGITGFGQLAFANETEILDPENTVGHYVGAILPQKIGLDQLYARRWSIRGDVRILIWTILPVILRADVAVNRQTGSLTLRRRKAERRSD
ncbi:MAG: sugar transferase [Thermoleophilia bacterium]